jgi:hypothetical protein
LSRSLTLPGWSWDGRPWPRWFWSGVFRRANLVFGKHGWFGVAGIPVLGRRRGLVIPFKRRRRPGGFWRLFDRDRLGFVRLHFSPLAGSEWAAGPYFTCKVSI